MSDWLARCFGWTIHPAAELVIGVVDCGQGWTTDGFRLNHSDTGVSIWIRNQWHGFGFRIDGYEAMPNDLPGGVDKRSRKQVITAVKRHLKHGTLAADDAKLRAFALRVTAALEKQLAA